MTTIIILTGPPAAGKNTIASLLAQRVPRCAIIDVDLVRWMVVQPHKAPWEGDEGKNQQLLGIRNACQLAHNFIEADFNVLILDVLSQDTALLYKLLLAPHKPAIVLLQPTFAEIASRNRLRPRLTDEQIRMLYKQCADFTDYDERIDNTNVPAEQIAL